MIDIVRSSNDQVELTNDPGMTKVQVAMTNESHLNTENCKLNTGGEDAPDMIPVRMLNEFTYCPRLGYLEWVEGEWAGNLETMEGTFGHRRVDQEPKRARRKAESGERKAEEANDQSEEKPALSDPSENRKLSTENSAPIHSRSLMLSAPTEGLLAKLDLVELEGMTATPVDYKRGKAPNIPEGAYEPERVQLCAQGLILRANGFQCDRGVLYFIASKKRITIEFTDELIQRTRQLRDDFRTTAAAGILPPPLIDSPKCPRCSLVGICLPDETNLLQIGYHSSSDEAQSRHHCPSDESPLVTQRVTSTMDESCDTTCDSLNTENRTLKTGSIAAPVRKLLPAKDDALPLYVQTQGAMLGKSGDRMTIKYKDEVLAERRLMDVSQVSLFGNVMISAQALRELTTRGIPVCHFTYGGWFHGITTGLVHKNVELRIRQFEIAANPERSLQIARWFISGKIRNSRTLLRRHLNVGGFDSDVPSATDATAEITSPGTASISRERILESLAEFRRKAEQATSAETLLGLEGMAAKTYFAGFFGMLNGRHDFDVNDRNRRPPRDPVNAVLSFVYSLLVKELTIVLQAVGFDPMLGFFHRPRYGRPSLALDVAEEYRPLICDSAALMAFNNGEVDHSSFLERAGAVTLTEQGRKSVIAAFERRLEQEVTHPTFGYRISYRRILEVQTRMLARHVTGELPEFLPFCTR
ncbi:MAG TPA: CRISPR-associated endonuclease Cas1 [Planctomycetaceae bacterium]|nr:CRISPR-associated endonuclease Cas1 [Planctomycetaceae bacterium]